MRLVLDNDPQILTVRRYLPGEIEVADQVLRAPCILSPARLITDWAVPATGALDLESLQALLRLRPNIILIGTDAAGQRPGGAVRRAIEARGVAIEIMDLGAACRTYNVLAQERREVVAGLFP
jgi:uncharacterized protein